MAWLTQSRWPVIKDVILTVAALVLIGSQVVKTHPDVVFIYAGIVLAGFGLTFHIGPAVEAVIGRSGGTSSSPGSSHSSSSSGSSPPPGH